MNSAGAVPPEHCQTVRMFGLLHGRNPRERAITSAAAWMDTLGTSGSIERANITGVATGSRNRLTTEARTGTRPSRYQARPADVMVTQSELKALLSYDPETGQFAWLAGQRKGLPAGFGHSRGRVQICISGKNYYSHRLAWLYMFGAMPDGVIDHINGDSMDNRIANLRATDQSGNLQNQRRARSDNVSSGLIGVSRKRGKWRAAIKVAGRSVHLGTFESREAAAEAYISAKRLHHPTCTI